MRHCTDIARDRTLGALWEKQFCEMASNYGFDFTPLQLGRPISAIFHTADLKIYTLPDITIWTYPGQHHEIKHKNPTQYNTFGLEAYRFYALLKFANITEQSVLYTIHNHGLAGGRNKKENKIEHWLTTDIRNLQDPPHVYRGSSYVNGKKQTVKMFYWPTSLWIPLKNFWDEIQQKDGTF